MDLRKKVKRLARDVCICIAVFLCWLVLHIISAKTNTIHNGGINPYRIPNNIEIVSWEKTFQEWDTILSQSISLTLIFCVIYFLFIKKTSSKNNANEC